MRSDPGATGPVDYCRTDEQSARLRGCSDAGCTKALRSPTFSQRAVLPSVEPAHSNAVDLIVALFAKWLSCSTVQDDSVALWDFGGVIGLVQLITESPQFV